MSDFQKQCTELAHDFRSFGEKARTGLAKNIETASILVERTAKKLFKGRNDESVKNEPPRVQTGRLRASITHRLKSDLEGVYGEVGTNVEYGHDLEFGTSKSWPHPFLTPALDMNRKEIENLIMDGMNKEVENA